MNPPRRRPDDARGFGHGLRVIKASLLTYDVAAIAAAPSVCAWLAGRYGLGYVAFYLVLVPALSYVGSLLVDRLEGGGRGPVAAGQQQR